METTRPTQMEINLGNFENNISEIKKLVGEGIEIMPVFKANAYGTYINTRLEVLNKFSIIAVANCDEAESMRKIGYNKQILVLNQPYESEIDKIIENDITIGLCLDEFAKKLGEKDFKFKVHLEIETGMGRTGVSKDNIKDFVKSLPQNVQVEGVYTHFSSADFDDDYTKAQLECFNNSVEILKSLCSTLKYIHCSASSAILNYPNAYFNMVRPGIIMYGYEPFTGALSKISVKPVAKLKSKITFLKTVGKGKAISYGQKYITEKETKIATIPIGYADGFRRTFSNNGEVVINGIKSPIIGNVCMDSFMVDVTNIPNVKVGDDVYIWDNEMIKLENLAEKCNTINYEIISGISLRVPRVFK